MQPRPGFASPIHFTSGPWTFGWVWIPLGFTLCASGCSSGRLGGGEPKGGDAACVGSACSDGDGACLGDCDALLDCAGGSVSVTCRCGTTVVSSGFCCNGAVQNSACELGDCGQGAVTGTCVCGSAQVSSGYCCSGVAQSSACAATACAQGEVSTTCTCGETTVSSGYCCSALVQSTPCGPRMCQQGAVGTTCACGSVSVSSGYCCGAVPQEQACMGPELSRVRLDGGLGYGTRTYDGKVFEPLLPRVTAGQGGDSGDGGTTPIANTDFDGLYQNETWISTSPMIVSVPVENGSYTVHLHFADWHPTDTSAAGDRKFHVDVQGQRVFTDLDIIAEVGKNAALVKGVNTAVTNGTLTVTFTNHVFYAEVAAIEILPAGEAHLATTTAAPCGTTDGVCPPACTHAQDSDCPDTTPPCGDGAVISTCICGTTTVSSNYCCGGTPQTGACIIRGCGDDSVNGLAEECDNGTDNGVVCNPPTGGTCTYCSTSCRWVTVGEAGCALGTTDCNLLFVSTTGSDSNPGTLESPFGTPEKARDTIRNLGHSKPVTVYFRGGVYPRTSTFALASSDSGTSTNPVIYAAYPGETVTFSGGKTINPAAFAKVNSSTPRYSDLPSSAVSNIYAVNLGSLGLSASDYGELSYRDSWGANPEVGALELFFNDEAMTLARWPNIGEATHIVAGYAKIAEVGESSIGYSQNNPSTWGSPTEGFVYSRPREIWDEYHVRIADIDTASKVISFDSGWHYANTRNADGAVFFAYNIPEELNAPGEWFLDRASGTLLFYPPAALSGSEVVVSTLDVPLLETSSASYITFKGIDFAYSRAMMVAVDSGSHHIVFSGVRVRHGALHGLRIDGDDSGLRYSEVRSVGNTGVTLNGENCFVENSELHNTSRWTRLYNPAIQMNGNYASATHNLIYDEPHQAIQFDGQNALIELNDIHHVIDDADDSGAIYHYQGDPSGVLIKNNFIHDCTSPFSALQEGGIIGVYCDETNGCNIQGNIMYNISGRAFAVFVNGGVNHVVTNNVVGDMENAFAFHCGYLSAGNIVFSRNGADGNATTFLEYRGGCDEGIFSEMTGNVEDASPLFVDEAGGDFSLSPSSPMLAVSGFQGIPFDEIGIQP